MSWEGIAAIVAVAGLFFTIIVNIGVFSFFFGKFFAKFDGLVHVFGEFQKAFEKHMENEEKINKSMWAKLDTHSEKLVEHHQRILSLEK